MDKLVVFLTQRHILQLLPYLLLYNTTTIGKLPIKKIDI